MDGEVGYIQVLDLRHNNFYLKAIKFNWKKAVLVIIYNLTRDYYSFIKRLKLFRRHSSSYFNVKYILVCLVQYFTLKHPSST